MARLATASSLIILAACPAAGTRTAPPALPAAAPLHEAIDVPVVNLSRGDTDLPRTDLRAVWTGAEVVYVGLGVTSLWLGRSDAEGRTLATPVEVPLGHPVSAGAPPIWIDGTVAAVYDAGQRRRWIRVRPSGEVVVDRELDVDGDWSLSDSAVAYLGAAGFAVVEHPRTGDGSRRLAWFDLAGERQGAPVDLGCSIPYAVTGVGAAVAFACRTPGLQATKEEDGFVAVIQDRTVRWRHAIRPGGHVVLGTDGARVLATYDADPNGPHAIDTPQVPVRTDLLGPTGSPDASTIVPSLVPELGSQMIWTGNEFATASDRWIFRYGRDGKLVGVWDVEPRCNREFHASSLIWTGEQYLVIGNWGWQACPAPLGRTAAGTDADRVQPLAPGLRWDPTTDTLEPPTYDW